MKPRTSIENNVNRFFQEMVYFCTSDIEDIPLPNLVFGICPQHDLDSHYCNDTIYLPTDDIDDSDYDWLLRHEFLHWIFDLVRRGLLGRGNEEDVCELFGDGYYYRDMYPHLEI